MSKSFIDKIAKIQMNTYIRTIYSPDLSSLTMSYYKQSLTFSFTPYIGKDNRGFDQYDNKSFISTTVDCKGGSVTI